VTLFYFSSDFVLLLRSNIRSSANTHSPELSSLRVNRPGFLSVRPVVSSIKPTKADSQRSHRRVP